MARSEMLEDGQVGEWASYDDGDDGRKDSFQVVMQRWSTFWEMKRVEL